MKTLALDIQLTTVQTLAAIGLTLLLFLPACGGGSSGEAPASGNDPCDPNPLSPPALKTVTAMASATLTKANLPIPMPMVYLITKNLH